MLQYYIFDCLYLKTTQEIHCRPLIISAETCVLSPIRTGLVLSGDL